MNIEIWWIGKTNEKYIKQGIDIFYRRLKHYNKILIEEVKDLKGVKRPEELKVKEGELILSRINNNDYLILCDEQGQEMDSIAFSGSIQKWIMDSSYKRIIFLIAGAFGASEGLKERANFTLSLSKMTFSHQMIRIFLLEQLYRGFTILKNEKYHNI